MLNIHYGLWIGFWCALASLLGLIALNSVMKKFDRQSPLVFMLTFVMGISAILVPLFGIIDVLDKLSDTTLNYDILGFNNICEHK